MRHFLPLSVGLLLYSSLFDPQTAGAVPVNLSPSGIATSSPVYDDDEFAYGAQVANDGLRLGAEIWHSTNTATDPIWWEVDLGTDYYLDRVQIFPRALTQALVKNFTIDVYNTANANVFSEQFLPRRSTGDQPWATDALRNVQGSRIRITREPQHLLGWDSAMTFSEFEVWGDSAPNLQNLALDRPVTASPAMAGAIPTTADLANDGNMSGHFYLESLYLSATPGAGQFWQVDLESLNAISYVNVFARTDDPTQNGSIRISILGADGATVVDSADTSLAGEDFGSVRYDLTQLFGANPVGRYVRIETLDADKILALGEVQVFGVASGSSAGAQVPEPSTWALAALALALAIFAKIRVSRRSGFSLALCLCGSFLFVGSVRAIPTNLAPSGTVAASSLYDVGYEAVNANDGDRSGDVIWHSAPTTVTDPIWWEVDLGTDRYLDRVQIFPRNLLQSLVKDFTIDVFNAANANVFSQTFFPSKSTGDEPWGTNALRNVRGSKVRITRDAPHLPGFDDVMTFSEFEVWGQSEPIPENLALGRSVTSSPELTWVGPTDATLANDGNLSGHIWHESVYHSDSSAGAPFTGPYGNGHFWQVELANPTAISYVNVFARTDDITQNGAIRISIVGADGTTIVDSADTTLGGDDLAAQRYDLTQLFPTNPVGSFVRIEMLETDKTLALGEVEVFGVAEGPGTPGDYNGNGVVDAADYTVWRDALGSTASLPNDSTPNVTMEDYTVWKENFGMGSGAASGSATIPEPTSAMLLALASLAFHRASRRKWPL